MRYLRIAILVSVLGFVGCGMGRDDTPPPEVNLDTTEIVIEIGEVYIPEGDDSFLELEEN